MTKSILIDGNGYGFGNIGDDAILCGILELLDNTNLDLSIIIATKNAIKPQFVNKNYSFIKSFYFSSEKKTIKKCDYYIAGGGTLIGDELGVDFPLKYNAKRLAYAKLSGKRTILFSIGANKLITKYGKKIAKNMIHNTDLISVRDLGSWKVCKELHPNKIPILSVDPAYLLKPMESLRTKEIKRFILSKKKTIGINVINEVWLKEKKYKIAIADAISAISEKHGYYPVFFSNEVREGEFFDNEANKETAKFLRCDYSIMDPIYYTPEEMIDIISNFDIIFSMRMHALIFASIVGIPFVTISRTDKVDNFMKIYGFKPSGTIDSVYSESLVKDIEALIENSGVSASIKNVSQQQYLECKKMSGIIQKFLLDDKISNNSIIDYLKQHYTVSFL